MRTNSHKFLKRLTIAASSAIVVFGMSSCTKSFCTNQDKANNIYALYGNLFNDSTVVTDDYSNNVNVQDGESERVTSTQNTNRKSLYNSLTSTYGVSLPAKAFNEYINNKATEEANNTYKYWMDGTFAKGLEEDQAKAIATHVALYAGITYTDSKPSKVADLWTNFDVWYQSSVTDLGLLVAPNTTYVSSFKNLVSQNVTRDNGCITPESKTFSQNGSNIYIEGKSWGQAFADYGFFEGLFVWPFAWLVYTISETLGNTAWAQILAIFVVTILARLITIISTLIQSRTQAKQQALKPALDELAKKYPNANEDQEQQRALMMERTALFRKNKVHPMLPLLFMIIQFPLFICVWSALQGSASLASGNVLGLSLTTTVSTCFTNYKNTPGAIVGILIFIVMTLANVLSSLSSLWFTNWRNKKFGDPNAVPVSKDGMDPNKTGKMMTYIMMVFVVIMGWSLPAGMGIYWLFGSLIAILQTLLMQAMQTKSAHKIAASTGDGSDLAAIRRSKHHIGTASNKKTKKNKSDSDKPMWR